MDEIPDPPETEQTSVTDEWELPLTADTEFGASSAHGLIEIKPSEY